MTTGGFILKEGIFYSPSKLYLMLIICLLKIVCLWFQEVSILIYLEASPLIQEGLLLRFSAIWYLISINLLIY